MTSFDSHAHFPTASAAEHHAQIARAREAGLCGILAVGGGPELDPGAIVHFDLGALSYGIVLAALDRGLGTVINGVLLRAALAAAGLEVRLMTAMPIPSVAEPVNDFDGIIAPVELAVAQEKRVTEQIHGLTRTAREENDFAAEQFMQWFIKEQVEEVATMQDLLAVVGRSQDDVNDIETYVERELGGGDADPTAPPVADA